MERWNFDSDEKSTFLPNCYIYFCGWYDIIVVVVYLTYCVYMVCWLWQFCIASHSLLL